MVDAHPRYARLLFVASLAYFLWTSTIGWSNPLLDFHEWRQTQTAISTQYMVDYFPTVYYETPVLGPPWRIPFEFPLYQWLVAGLVTVFRTPLDQTGRFVSVAFFFMTFVPANRLLVALKFPESVRLMMLSLLLTCPFYVFWSRTFMIESAALFLAMSYLASVVSLVEKSTAWMAAVAIAFGSLAAMVKVTTFTPCFAAAATCLAFRLWRRPTIREALLYAAILAIPVTSFFWWTSFADIQKDMSMLSAAFVSRKMHAWSFGTIDQRLTLGTWHGIFQRELYVFGDKFVVLGAFIGLCLSRRRWLEFAVCMALYLIAPLIFANLHLVHEYYAYANNIFLVAAVGVCLAAMVEHGGWLQRGAIVGVGIALASQLHLHHRYYEPYQRTAKTELSEISETVATMTNADDVIVIFGCDWSSVIPYYAKRRALMIPFWAPNLPASEYWDGLEDYRIGAIVVHRHPQYPLNDLDKTLIQDLVGRTGFELKIERIVSTIDSYELYGPR